MHDKKVLAMGVVLTALLAAGIFSATSAQDNDRYAHDGFSSVEQAVTTGMGIHLFFDDPHAWDGMTQTMPPVECGVAAMPPPHVAMGMKGLHDMHESGHHHGSQVSADEGHDKDVYYTCPMHPEVRSDQPGQCPKCGMNLVKKEKSE